MDKLFDYLDRRTLWEAQSKSGRKRSEAAFEPDFAAGAEKIRNEVVLSGSATNACLLLSSFFLLEGSFFISVRNCLEGKILPKASGWWFWNFGFDCFCRFISFASFSLSDLRTPF